MKRRHLFEAHELSVCPQAVRELVTGFLEMVAALFQPYSPKSGLFVRAMRSTNASQFVDLCSGNGGPWLVLAQEIERQTGQSVSVVLTDKFPSQETRRRNDALEWLTYIEYPVDARCVPGHLRGVRTLFNGLHHFQRDDAKAVLQDAVANRQPIVVFESLQRDWFALAQALMLPVCVLFLTPFVRPLRWSRLVLTYIIPLAPLILLWDGVVSVLRCYRPDELRAMTDELSGDSYHWEFGAYRHLSVPVTFMVGYPIDRPSGEHEQRQNLPHGCIQ
jgi:hypothetical protein